MNTHLLLSLAARSFAPPLLALILVSALRKSSASNRRMVWIMSFVVLTVLPLALLKLPTATVVDYSRPVAPAFSAASDRSPVVIASNTSSETISTASPAPATMAPSPSGTIQGKFAGGNGERPWAKYGAILWVVGALVVLANWIAGLIRLSRLPLQPVLDDGLVSELEIACRCVGLERMPRLSTCGQATAPMMFGHFRPSIVLPVEARSWSADTLQAVFLHECAHMKRNDWLGLMFSRLLTAIYWFNPLTWLAATQLRAECEAAADDTVILNGVSPGLYASELLRIAMEVRPPAIANSLALLEVGPLKKRIERVLERNRSRGSASPRAIALSLVLSLALTAAIGFTFQVVDAPVVAHNGYASLGHGKYVRLIAIVKRTKTGTQAWNIRGELLPNSFPLPDRFDDDDSPGKNLRYFVFAQNSLGLAIEEADNHKLHGTRNLDAVMSGDGSGYAVRRIDGDPLSVASLAADGSASTSIHCKVWNEPAPSPRVRKPEKTVVFDRVPMDPTGLVTASADLDVPSIQTVSDTNAVGALIGIADLSHPEWGYWRPDGTPLPKIEGAAVPRVDDGHRPKGNITRRVGFLFRSRENNTDRVTTGDASGVLLASAIDSFHTPSGRYDLNEVFLDPSLTSMRVFSKVPMADKVFAHLKLSQIPPSKENEKVADFFAHRIGKQAACFGFDHKLSPEEAGTTRSLQFLCADKSTPPFIGVSTDWEDGAVAVNTKHPEKIVAANVLKHGYVYFSYANVALFPKGRR